MRRRRRIQRRKRLSIRNIRKYADMLTSRIFAVENKDKDGVLNKNECLTAFMKLNPNCSARDLGKLNKHFQDADKNGDGVLTRNELSNYLKNMILQKQNSERHADPLSGMIELTTEEEPDKVTPEDLAVKSCELIFHKEDNHHKGKITQSQGLEGLLSIEPNCDEKTLKDFQQEFVIGDEKNNKPISFDQFKKFLKKMYERHSQEEHPTVPSMDDEEGKSSFIQLPEQTPPIAESEADNLAEELTKGNTNSEIKPKDALVKLVQNHPDISPERIKDLQDCIHERDEDEDKPFKKEELAKCFKMQHEEMVEVSEDDDDDDDDFEEDNDSDGFMPDEL